MKVAIAAEGEQVSAHFGHCKAYVLADVADGRVDGVQVLAAPEHEPGALPAFLNSHGVKAVVAGGMGARAVGLFAGYGIEAITGVTGTVEDALAHLAAGDLQSGPSLCDH